MALTESLIAYDADGNVVGSLPFLVQRRPDGTKVLVDFAAKEAAGEPFDSLVDPEGGVWHDPDAVGSKVWPERIDRPHDFRIEKEGEPGHRRLAALVHKQSGYRRERVQIERAIEERLSQVTREAGGEMRLNIDQYLELVADIVGLPTEPLQLTSTGRTRKRPQRRARR